MGTGDVEPAYNRARERYAEVGVDTDRALAALAGTAVSLNCWQGDDVGGFEPGRGPLSSGGLQVTGGRPGRARTVEELRADLEKAYSLIPGKHRLQLHAMYGDFGGRAVPRDEIEPRHFHGWVEWARAQGLGLDLSATCFSHPRAADGFTLSHQDPGFRRFWVEHVKRCREIGAFMGRELGTPCLHTLWIPDGSKEVSLDRWERRLLLRQALDDIYSVNYDAAQLKDAVEGKLFGIGSESFVVGSHEFYLCYALQRGLLVCLDTGHFHPTESVADKLSALLLFFDELMLHISRGVRWDSDHVPIVSDDLYALMQEVVRAKALARLHLALDFFDAGLNRVGAWVIGARALLKALLFALLEPSDRLREAEESGDVFARLAWLEEAKTLPLGAVWDYHCLKQGALVGEVWIAEARKYENTITSRRR